MIGGRAGGPSGRLAATLLALLALLVAATHVPYLAKSLEDIDSINFALGIREYDPSRHQPHPPGYPVYIFLGTLAAASVTAVAPDLVPERVEARALAIVSLVSALLAVPLLYALFCGLDRRRGAGSVPWREWRPRAFIATLLTVSTPLFWYMAARPMSDVPGLAAALAAQVLLGLAWWRQQPAGDSDRRLSPASTAASGRMIVLGALVAGFAIGFRSQVAWMTLPLLGLVLMDRIGRGVAGALLGGTIAFSAGVLLWAVPMIAATGGLGAYLAALGDQGGEDFAGVEMLYQQPSPRLLVTALQRSLVLPWDSDPLAALVLALAAVGFVALLVRDRRSAAMIMALAAPYAVFHLLFHDTAFVRYALPLVPAVAFLAACGAEILARRAAPVVAVGLACWSLAVAQPVLVAYGDGLAPAWEAMRAMRAEATYAPPGAVMGHHQFRRVFEVDPPAFAPVRPMTPRRGWLEARRYWLEGHDRRLWFLGDPRRTDLALFDPHALDDAARYAWNTGSPSGVGGMRPSDVTWFRMRRPGWMLAEGWAVTPETAGMAQLAGRAPHVDAITADVARRPDAATVMVGGRYFGGPADPSARFEMEIDGASVASWESAPGFFLRFIDLPAGVLGEDDRGFASLAIRSYPPEAPTAIEQFDLQTAGGVVWGFGEGWHEAELDATRGELWRWMSERGAIEVRQSTGDRQLTLSGASPLRDFDAPPTIVIRVGDRELGRLSPTTAFQETFAVPGDALARAGGRITIETDRFFVPAERGGPPDRRQLGLRIFSVALH